MTAAGTVTWATDATRRALAREHRELVKAMLLGRLTPDQRDRLASIRALIDSIEAARVAAVTDES